MPGKKLRSIKGPKRMYEKLKRRYGKTRAAKITNAYARKRRRGRKK